MYTKILVPLDGSEVAEGALPHAEALAVKFGASVVLLRVVSPPGGVLPFVAPGGAPMVHPAGVVDAAPLLEAEEKEVDRYLAATAGALAARGVAVSQERQEGQPAEVVLRRARELPADLIAMTTHGRSGLRRLVLGSVAESVLREAPCPVLAVRVAADR